MPTLVLGSRSTCIHHQHIAFSPMGAGDLLSSGSVALVRHSQNRGSINPLIRSRQAPTSNGNPDSTNPSVNWPPALLQEFTFAGRTLRPVESDTLTSGGFPFGVPQNQPTRGSLKKRHIRPTSKGVPSKKTHSTNQQGGSLKKFLRIWVWLKIKQEGQTAGFGPCFHLPGQPIVEFRFF